MDNCLEILLPPSTSLNLELSRRCISVTSEKLACVAGEKRGGGGEREKSAKAGKREGSPSPLSPFPLSFSLPSQPRFDACYTG